MKSIPIYDDTKPISCSIDSDEIPARIELVERMRANLESIARGEHGLLLHFPNRPGVEADLERFTVDEKRCCEFWGFAVQRRPERLTLRWDAPPHAAELVTHLLAYFRGEEPITAIRGLL